jgi:NAD(P)H-quinone oxidoreductase subunit 5
MLNRIVSYRASDIEMSGLIEHIWLVPVYPLVVALLIILGRWLKLMPRVGAMILTVLATTTGLVHAVGALQWLLANPHGAAIEQNVNWLAAGPLQLKIGTLLDPLSVMMLLVVTFISLFIQIYTHGYMSHDKGYCRFYAFLALFNFAMLGLVLSTNLFQMYMFWELVGVCSFLLIGFWFHKDSAAKACLKAFLMNRVGDFGLLVGILSLLLASFSWWQPYLAANTGSALLSFQALPGAVQHAFGQLGPVWFTVVTLLVFMGPMAKSAQLPLHTWLPDAMEGPTPISALIHAATMVAAGVYLVARVFPMLEFSPWASGIIAGIGCLTALVAATIALTQTDIKKALAYSTMSQLGFMMAAIGVGAVPAALFHLFTHAFFKAMLFLGSGSVIHACEDEQDMRQMGGLLKKLPITGWTYLIGCLSISGFLLSGFWSKDLILVGALNAPVVFAVLAFTAGMTAFYMFRTFFMTFMGTYRGTAHVHHESPVMVMPLVVLAVPSLAVGFLLSGLVPGVPSFQHLFLPGFHHELSPLQHQVEHTVFAGLNPIGWLSLALGGLGAVMAYLFYGARAMFSADRIRRAFPALYALFNGKWFFDELYQQGVLNRLYMPFAKLSSRFDNGIIDGVVTLGGQAVLVSGSALRAVQNGSVQWYLAIVAVGAFSLACWFVYSAL